MKKTAIATLDGLKLSKESVPSMLEMVRKEIKTIKGDKEEVTKTEGDIPGFGRPIRDLKTVNDIIKAHSFIEAKKKAFNSSREALGLEADNYIFKLGKYNADTWIDHLKAHLIITKNKTKLEKLNKVKEILEANLSEEMKFAKQMQDMVGLLKDLKVD